jgi:rubredoxin
MVVVQDLAGLATRDMPPVFRELFICPSCGSIGIVGEKAFTRTERPSWFRCDSCEYVFGIELTRAARGEGVLL